MLKFVKYTGFVLISVVLMYFAFKDQNLTEIIYKLKNIEYKWLILSMIFGAIAIISRGLRWIYLLNALGHNASKANSINSVSIGYLTNILIPRAGEISRCTSLQQVEKIPFDKLFGTIILERAIDFAILISLILISFLYMFEEINSFFGEVFGLKIIVILLLLEGKEALGLHPFSGILLLQPFLEVSFFRLFLFDDIELFLSWCFEVKL